MNDIDPGPSPRWFELFAGLVVITLAAGCLAGSTPKEEPAGALSTRASAEQAAAQWHPEAELVSVAGGEGELKPLVQNGSLAWLPRYVDGVEAEIGDGRSPRWAYEFHAGEQGLGILVSANGTIVKSVEIDITQQPRLDGWTADSTEAVQAAADEHPAFRDVPEDTGVAYALYQDDRRGRPVWAVGLLTEDDKRLVVLVDARTGESLGISENEGDPITPRGRSLGPQAPPRAADTFEGHLTAPGDQQSWSLFLQNEGHPEIGLHLEVEEPASGSVNATLVRDDRSLVQLEAGPTRTNATASWPLPEAGDYEVSLELDAGLEQAYTLQWCAPGTEEGDERTSACRTWESRRRRG